MFESSLQQRSTNKEIDEKQNTPTRRPQKIETKARKNVKNRILNQCKLFQRT